MTKQKFQKLVAEGLADYRRKLEKNGGPGLSFLDSGVIAGEIAAAFVADEIVEGQSAPQPSRFKKWAKRTFTLVNVVAWLALASYGVHTGYKNYMAGEIPVQKYGALTGLCESSKILRDMAAEAMVDGVVTRAEFKAISARHSELESNGRLDGQAAEEIAAKDKLGAWKKALVSNEAKKPL